MKKILLIRLCMVLLAGVVGAADSKFQNKSGTDLMIIYGDTGNITTQDTMCFTSDCSTKIYSNGGGIIITS
jgi:hypothetical protein